MDYETIKHGILSFVDSERGVRVFDSLPAYLAARPEAAVRDRVGLIIHRQSWIDDDLGVYRNLAEALERRGLSAIAVFTDAETLSFRQLVDRYFFLEGALFIEALINGVVFHIKAREGRTVAEESAREFAALDIPVISPVQSYYRTIAQWEESPIPITIDMPHALIAPEMAGMIEPEFIGAQQSPANPEDYAGHRDSQARMEAIPEQADYLADRVGKYVLLRKKPNREKRIALMLHNAVCDGVEATIGKAFGLEAFESVARILQRLEAEGYHTGAYPPDGKALRDRIMERKAFSDFRWTAVEDIVAQGGCLYKMPVEGVYDAFYQELPREIRLYMEETWGTPPGEGMVLDGRLIISGLQFGNILVMVQPKRGCYGAKCTGEVCKILHDPVCPPPHQYLATYRYLERVFKADAIIDVGTDGSLEYLPGKTNGLSRRCWPHIVLGSVPSVYIYNAGVVNEALIAKRRLHSVVVDHLPPPAGGVDPDIKRLLARIFDYFRALELGNGQEAQIKAAILALAEGSPSAKRIIETGADFNTALEEIRDALKTAEEARKISRNHIFGAVPPEAEIDRYIQEALEGEFDEPAEGDADALRGQLRCCGEELDMLIHALRGGYIPPGEGGMPDENGWGILPTGRNLFGMNAAKIPTPVAWERGGLLAEQLLEQYRQEEGRLPEQIAMNMISLDISRSHGEQLSQFLWLLGVSPVWDKQEKVSGLRLMGLAELGRPRIDVTVRISGVMRDTWPMAVELMDQAVGLAASAEEGDGENYLLKHIRASRARLQDREGANEREAPVRIFGDPPGSYGAGLDLALLASAWKSETDLVKYFIQASAFAYGKGLQGRKSVAAFIENAKTIEASSDITASSRMNPLVCAFGAQVQGGFSLLAKHLGGKPLRSYQNTSERGKAPMIESLGDNLMRLAGETLLNPFWRDSLLAREYEGASELMHILQNVFSAQCLTECFPDGLLDQLTQVYVNDEAMRQWFQRHNPFALEEIARRMLELHSRGKWKPGDEVLQALRESYLAIEGDMEGRTESAGDIQGGALTIVTNSDVAAWKNKLAEIEAYIP